MLICFVLLQFLRGDLEAHYQSKIHQDATIKCIEQTYAKFEEQLENSSLSHTTTTTETDRDVIEKFSEDLKALHSVIDTLVNGSHNLADELSSLNSDFIPLSQTIEKTDSLLPTVKTSIEESNNMLAAMESNISMLQQNLFLLKQLYEDQQAASYDGTLFWKITGVRDKMSKNTVINYFDLIRLKIFFEKKFHSYVVLNVLYFLFSGC